MDIGFDSICQESIFESVSSDAEWFFNIHSECERLELEKRLSKKCRQLVGVSSIWSASVEEQMQAAQERVDASSSDALKGTKDPESPSQVCAKISMPQRQWIPLEIVLCYKVVMK